MNKFDPNNFDPDNEIQRVTEWTQEWFHKNKDMYDKCIVPMEFRPESFLTAAICARAIGKHNITAVIIANGKKENIDALIRQTDAMCITPRIINISGTMENALSVLPGYKFDEMDDPLHGIPQETAQLLESAVATSIIYATAEQDKKTAVANTMSLTDEWLGTGAKYGHYQGHLAPLLGYTDSEIEQMCHAAGIRLPTMVRDACADCIIRRRNNCAIINDTVLWQKEKKHSDNMHKHAPIPRCIPSIYPHE